MVSSLFEPSPHAARIKDFGFIFNASGNQQLSAIKVIFSYIEGCGNIFEYKEMIVGALGSKLESMVKTIKSR